MKNIVKYLLPVLIISGIKITQAQQIPIPGISGFSGNFEINAQAYQTDSAINAPEVPEKVLSNGFFNLNYTNGPFAAGIRYESYLNPLLGFDTQYQGSGITYRFASFTAENLTVTAGNFYDQFGSGLIFRSYEERALGVDNAMDGLHVLYKPFNGVQVKGFIAKQRNYFQTGPGIVRGIDGDFQLNDFITGWSDNKFRIALGGSFISKYQRDDSPSRILPENVGAWAGRMNINYGKWGFYGEYAGKINDPSLVNKYIYKEGEALYLNATYSMKGFGARLAAKRIDNMNFRSDRSATGNSLNINYLPAITKQYTYRLTTLYPYATQPNGEMGVAGEIYFNLKSGSPLGGTYGTTVSLNASAVNDITRKPASNDTLGYISDFTEPGENRFYQDFSAEINRKLSKKSKLILTYIYQLYDKNIIEGKIGEKQVTAHTGIIDYTYKINNSHSIRIELQHLSTEQDIGNWALGMIEYSISPNWSFSIFDEWNYGNEIENRQFHYYNGSIAYTKGPTRIGLGYARQRAGLLCVGGICRFVPASNGFNVTISSRF